MAIRPFVFPFDRGSNAYKTCRNWWLCPKCWNQFDFDEKGISSSEYPPKHCPNPECKAEWGTPIKLEGLSKKK